MKKIIIGLAIAASTAMSSSAFAFVCTAVAQDGSGAWGQGVSYNFYQAQIIAMNYCSVYSPYCAIVNCY
jgi:hypothetical protein